MSTTPTPADMARFVLRKHRSDAARTTTAVVADVAPTQPAEIAGRTTVGERVVPNIIKAIHAQPGITVRSWLGGRACGKPHQIEQVERTDTGVLITFSGRPAAEYKPAYRWYVVDALGLDLRYDASITERALVPYQEV